MINKTSGLGYGENCLRGVVEETALQREDADVLVFSGALVRPVLGVEDATPSTSQSPEASIADFIRGVGI